MDRDLQTLLLYDNPWIGSPDSLDQWFTSHLPEPFIPRKIIKTANRRWQEIGRAHLLVGPRQSGKSTAIWAHLASVGEPALFIDCEQNLVQQWCLSAPLFLADLEEVIQSRSVTLLFEEAQHLENAGLFLKGIVDRGFDAPILVTGSSSFHLGARVRESLAGRATRQQLLPFSLAEVTHDLAGIQGIARDQALKKRIERHLIFGGYPEVWLNATPEKLLMDLVEAVILRDASDFSRISRPDVFRRLLRLAAGQVGNLVNLSEWASILGISRDTVAAYLEILGAGHIVSLVPPFAGGRRSELTKTPKIFFTDNGIRNQLIHSFQPLIDRVDAGPIVENWVFGELRKVLPVEAGIHFWRSTSKAEVDFVVEIASAVVGLEVKAGPVGRPSISRSVRSFIEAYQPQSFLIVSTHRFDKKQLGSTEVSWITLDEVASTLQRLMAGSS